MGNSLGRPISNGGPKKRQPQSASFLSSSSESTPRAEEGKDEAEAKGKLRGTTIKLRRGKKDRQRATAASVVSRS